MLQIERVLFPTDFSPSAERAYIHAAYITAAHDAQLHAVHVSDVSSERERDLVPIDWAQVTEELGLGQEGDLSGLAPEQVVQKEIVGDNPGQALLNYADEYGIDLIVMGTHGRGGLERVLLGSVAERVVREAPCPVLTVRAPAEVQVRRILVPVDFSDLSRAVIPVAEALAEVYVASMELLYVIDEGDLPLEGAPLLGPVHVSPDELKKRMHKLMDDLVREYSNGIEVRGTVLVGDPRETVVEYATEHADLIVMGTHGRTGLKRLLLGSVAEHVARRSPVPVFTVKSFGRDPMRRA